MKKQVSDIVSEWMFGKLTSDEFEAMRRDVNKRSDNELRFLFQSLWDDPRTAEPMPAEARNRVLSNLQQTTRARTTRRWGRIAAIILLPLLIGWGGGYLLQPDVPYAQSYLTVKAAPGQKSQVTLPDGSVVWLNSESSLSYPADFGKKSRNVKLEGEGCFEVVKDEDRKFVVEASQLHVCVFGTKFNISAHPSNEIVSVTLLEGSVSVEDLSEKQLALLKPDQTLYYNKKSSRFSVEDVNASLSALWTENKCRFENATAEEVFNKMAYWYGLRMQVANMNTQYRYGFTIKNETVREMLELMNELTPLEYTINGEEVNIVYK